jgi:hypothetical protein
MNPSRLLFTVAALALTFLFTLAVPTAMAGSTKPAAPAPVDERILVQSVNVAAGTIVIQYMRDKKTHTYTVDDLTALKVNNSPGKIADIQVGMQIKDYVERDPHTLDTLTIQYAAPGPAPTPAKKK